MLSRPARGLESGRCSVGETYGSSNVWAIDTKQEETAQRIHNTACALDETLASQGWVMRDPDGHVSCFDGQVDTPSAAETMIEELAKAGWKLTRG